PLNPRWRGHSAYAFRVVCRRGSTRNSFLTSLEDLRSCFPTTILSFLEGTMSEDKYDAMSHLIYQTRHDVIVL
ncbi:hypothetical protein PMAYCL1PPCAC_26055, partial [Pristionchus mayeri]